VKGLLLGLALFFPGFCCSQPGPGIVQQLQKGGFVLYLRHASTDFSQNDEKMTSYEDCAHQRNLTDKGRAEARALGDWEKF